MQAKLTYYGVLAVLATTGAAITEALGGWDTALQTLVVLMAIDYVTGLLCALIWKKSPKTADGTFESKASLKGLIRKGAILLVVYIAARLDLLMHTDITRLAVIMFFIANDGFSIIENLGIIGVPLPEIVKNAFALLREKSDGLQGQPPAAAAADTNVGNKPEPPAPPTTGTNAKRPADEVNVHLAIEPPEDPAETYQPKHSAADLPDLPADIVEELPEEVSKQILEYLSHTGAEPQGLKGPKGESGEPGVTDAFHSDR